MALIVAGVPVISKVDRSPIVARAIDLRAASSTKPGQTLTAVNDRHRLSTCAKAQVGPARVIDTDSKRGIEIAEPLASGVLASFHVIAVVHVERSRTSN